MNYVEAFKYYICAANMGHTKALERLGVCYAEGEGVECDDDEAIRCLEQAVRQGSETAQEKIDILNYYNNHEIELAGKLIYGADGYDVDVQKGLDIVRKGINIGDCDAIYLMATQLITGLPPYICQDVEVGLNYIVEAAKKGSLSALYDLIGVHNHGDINGVPVELDDDSFGAWILEIAEAADFVGYGGNWAYAYAAWACRYGYGTEKDLGKARTWVSKMDPIMQSVEFIKNLEL